MAQTKDEAILKVQKKLETLGYYTGPLDGILGDLTQKALEMFQKDNGLSVTGKLDTKTKNMIALKKRLRSKSKTLSHENIIQMIKEKGFSHPFDLSSQQLSGSVKGHFQHKYKFQALNADKVVTDAVTDLMWQQGGSPDLLMQDGVQGYVDEMNKKQYAGFSDWRLPTVEELASLMENERKKGDLFINAGFSSTNHGSGARIK